MGEELDTLNKLEDTLTYFTNILKETELLHARAKEMDHNELAKNTSVTICGILGILDFVGRRHDALLDMMGAIKVPIINLDKPKRDHLTLVVDNT